MTKPMSDFVRRKLAEHNIEQRTDAWYKAREGRLTASDVAAAIGANKHCTPAALTRRKLEPRSFFGNAATAWGQKYEPEAIAEYERLSGNIVHECGFFQHPTLPWIGGSPDGIVDSPASLEHGTPQNTKLLEVKCPYFKDIEPYCPAHYYPQVQTCLEVLDMEACDFVQYVPGTTFTAKKIIIITIPRLRAWFDQQLPIMQKWFAELEHARLHPPPAKEHIARKISKPRVRKAKPYMLIDL